MIVKTPIGYEPDIVIVSFSNGQSINQRQQIDIVDGEGTIDLTMVLDGFFSANGGPYTLQFFDVESYELINFVATNGITYNCIEFQFQNGSEVDSITIST